MQASKKAIIWTAQPLRLEIMPASSLDQDHSFSTSCSQFYGNDISDKKNITGFNRPLHGATNASVHNAFSLVPRTPPLPTKERKPIRQARTCWYMIAIAIPNTYRCRLLFLGFLESQHLFVAWYVMKKRRNKEDSRSLHPTIGSLSWTNGGELDIPPKWRRT
jgi:hypothetical protein